jgi:hypothetical protein
MGLSILHLGVHGDPSDKGGVSKSAKPRLSSTTDDFHAFYMDQHIVRDHDAHVTMIPHAKITSQVWQFPILFCVATLRMYIRIIDCSLAELWHCN